MNFLIGYYIIENHTVIASKTKPSEIFESPKELDYLKSKSFRFDKTILNTFTEKTNKTLNKKSIFHDVSPKKLSLEGN